MKVYLTRRAEQNYNSIKDYIALEWGEIERTTDHWGRSPTSQDLYFFKVTIVY